MLQGGYLDRERGWALHFICWAFPLIWDVSCDVPSQKIKKSISSAFCWNIGAVFSVFYADRASTGGGAALMVFGDSLVAGYGLPAEQGFTSQLQDRAYPRTALP